METHPLPAASGQKRGDKQCYSSAVAIALAKTANGSRPLEIRLFRRAETGETSYTVDLGSTGSALRWPGSEKNRLTIRGQVDRSGNLPRALTIILGKGSLRQIMCEPRGVDLCAASPPEGRMDKRQDLIDYLASAAEELETQARNPIPLRMNCLLFWRAAFVEIADRISRLLARGRRRLCVIEHRAARHSNRRGHLRFPCRREARCPRERPYVRDCREYLRQSPSTYRSSPMRCDIHNDWSCPVSIWADVPWAVVHHYFWNPLNGALFTAKDILEMSGSPTTM